MPDIRVPNSDYICGVRTDCPVLVKVYSILEYDEEKLAIVSWSSHDNDTKPTYT